MQEVPPSGLGPLGKREERLAWGMLLPTILSVSLIIILPLCAIFWISFKPISLADLRPPTVLIKEQLKGQINAAGDAAKIRYRIRNSSQTKTLNDVTVSDIIPNSFDIQSTDDRCSVDETNLIYCMIGVLEGGQREVIEAEVLVKDSFFGSEKEYKVSEPNTSSVGDNILTNSELTFENFHKIFDSEEFITVILTTLFYTVFGTVGAVVVGLFAALLLNINFRGKGLVRGLYLFPYVAPVIAVAFSWINLFDPFSGSVNHLLLQMNVLDSPINFFGQRPNALIMVTIFEIWRYFPLSFLFILARMQSIDTEMYEAADMDGASPLQKFWYISLPMLIGIMSILFLLRFIWTFNKFDDIFLLTGGASGTRTLTVNVYEQAFAVSNIGAGAAVAVVIFIFLLIFSLFFFKFFSKEEGL